jgi:hypothetical protein
MKKRSYVNGVEITRENSARGKELLSKMPRFHRKLNGYGDWTESQKSKTLIETFEQDGYEFFVVTYEAMDFSLHDMKMSASYLHTEVRWQPKN